MSQGAKSYEERCSWRGWADRGGVSGQRQGQAPGPSPPLQLADAGAVVTVGSWVAKLHHSYVTVSQEGGEAKGEAGGGVGGEASHQTELGHPHVYC